MLNSQQNLNKTPTLLELKYKTQFDEYINPYPYSYLLCKFLAVPPLSSSHIHTHIQK